MVRGYAALLAVSNAADCLPENEFVVQLGTWSALQADAEPSQRVHKHRCCRDSGTRLWRAHRTRNMCARGSHRPQGQLASPTAFVAAFPCSLCCCLCCCCFCCCSCYQAFCCFSCCFQPGFHVAAHTPRLLACTPKNLLVCPFEAKLGKQVKVAFITHSWQ